MPKKLTYSLSDLILKAEDCYDPADYVLVHKGYLVALQAALTSRCTCTLITGGHLANNPQCPVHRSEP